jgi:uncharacterized membrane protein
MIAETKPGGPPEKRRGGVHAMSDATVAEATTHTPRIRIIDLDRPWAWLAAGWRDLLRAPGASLPYGAAYAVVGCALTTVLWLEGVLYLSLPLAAMFTLIGPLVAVGFYDISRRLAAGEPVSFARSAKAWQENPSQIALMGVALLLLALAWMRLAFLLFLGFFGYQPMAPEALTMIDTILAPEHLDFLVVGTATGAVLAAVAFAISVVSMPLLLDHREANVITAIVTSVRTVLHNIWPMALWAWLVAMFIAVGIATAYIGLIVTLPLIGHASWHAYKDLVAWDERPDYEI